MAAIAPSRRDFLRQASIATVAAGAAGALAACGAAAAIAAAAKTMLLNPFFKPRSIQKFPL